MKPVKRRWDLRVSNLPLPQEQKMRPEEVEDMVTEHTCIASCVTCTAEAETDRDGAFKSGRDDSKVRGNLDPAAVTEHPVTAHRTPCEHEEWDRC